MKIWKINSRTFLKFIGYPACLVVLTLALLLSACQSGKDIDAFADLSTSFQVELDRICTESGFPGITAAFILSDGQSAGFASGFADKEEQILMTPESRMLSGSIGKTFVAAVALSLAQEGAFSLDDKIIKWFGDEDWFPRLPNGPEITLRMFLTHSSGLSDHVHSEKYGQAILRMIGSADPDFCFEPREIVAFVLDQKPLFAPGQGYSYTDTGYILIGMIIEKTTGSTYYEELHKRILGPMQLKRTSPSDRRDLSGLAAGYIHPDDNPFGLPEKTTIDGGMLFNPANEWTGGGLITNPQDLVRWAKLLYEGKALDKPYLEELLNSGFKDGKNQSHYGLGVGVKGSELGMTYGHGGWFPGYSSMVSYYPEQKIAIAVQVNTDHKVDMNSIIRRLTKTVLASIE
ncbi:MAG: beta-lactamase family protein [Candidatus Aminicenantes bacterium]|nr:beta-lactamase family protein [Candidatus Aminicenantes bacterium]